MKIGNFCSLMVLGKKKKKKLSTKVLTLAKPKIKYTYCTILMIWIKCICLYEWINLSFHTQFIAVNVSFANILICPFDMPKIYQVVRTLTYKAVTSEFNRPLDFMHQTYSPMNTCFISLRKKNHFHFKRNYNK